MINMTGALLGLIVVALYVFWRSGFRVDNGSVGVCTEFGEFVRDSSGAVKTFGPGLHWKKPWAAVTIVSLGERSFSLEEGSAIEVLAADGTRIRVNARLRFRVQPDRVGVFLADAKDPTEDLRGLFRLALREQFARFSAQRGELSAYTALRLRMNELQERILLGMQKEASHEYGVEAIAVDLLQIDPPEDMIDALNAVITAESEASALIARTELQCQQRLLSAEKAIEIAHANAAAVESEIRTVGRELSTLAAQGTLTDYVSRRRAEVLGHSRRVYFNHSSNPSAVKGASS